jgi:hypothetical protein
VEVRFAKPDDREALLDLVNDFVGFFCSLRGEQHVTAQATRDKQRLLFDPPTSTTRIGSTRSRAASSRSACTGSSSTADRRRKDRPRR